MASEWSPQPGKDLTVTDEMADLYMRGAMLVALADGVIDPDEKHLLRKLQKKLRIDNDQLRELVQEIKDGHADDLQVPASPRDRYAALDAMVVTAQADGEISSPEALLLERIAKKFDITGDVWNELYRKAVDRANRMKPEKPDRPEPSPVPAPSEPEVSPELREELRRLIDDFYTHFHDWPDARQRAQRLVDIGPASVTPVIRAFESYRKPAGDADLLALKALFADILGQLRDPRALYYLASQLQLDDENEITSPSLRAVIAEVVGKIIGQPFSRDENGIVAARQWWLAEGTQIYNRLAF